MIGKTISHYKILSKLGQGGMGVVYKAQDTKLDRLVALKFLPSHLITSETDKARFLQEAKTASAINHSNVCVIHDIQEYENQQFIVMEFVDGITLSEKIQEKPIEIEEAINYTKQIAEALQAAHEKDIIHRDIKSSNIIVNIKNQIKILDFGLAKLKGSIQLTKTSSTVGTTRYMSPEQIRGEEIDYRTDIWSLGVVVFEMLTGKLPFKGDYEQAMMYSILNEEPKSLKQNRSDLPQNIEQVISKSLEKNKLKRYQNIEEILQDFKTPIETKTESQKKSIAVLPFVNMSADPEQEYFCDGMAEEIINALTHIENLHVVARTSAFSFKGKNIDIREIGRKLNVDSVLEGSVRKAGNKLRITAQFINIADGYHLWSERFDLEMEDIFAIQDEISITIMDKLKVKLLGEEKGEILKRSTHNLEAYNLYLKGRYFCQMFTVDGFEKAIELYEQALQNDPNYALAYAGIAEVYIFYSYFGNMPPKKALVKAKSYLHKALDEDDRLAEAHTLMGRIYTFFEWDWLKAHKEFEKALELKPHDAMIHFHFSALFMLKGQHDKSIYEICRARELDPLSIIINTIVSERFWQAGQFDRAIEEIEKTIAMNPNFY